MTQRSPGAAPPALELRDVAKSFGSVVALRSGTLTLEDGRIHALVGENGAGKSTLVKIIAGLYQRDSGDFLLRGETVDFRSTADAKAAGIAVIYQEPTLFPDLSVTENIFMGRQPLRSFAPHRPQGDAHRGDRALRATRRPHPSRPPGPRPLDRRPADHRDRQGDLPRRPGAHHGRADRRPQRRRGRPPVRRRPRPERRRPRPALHLAPLRRGVRPLRLGHRLPRRRLHRDLADRRHLDRPARAPDGRPRGRGALPEGPGRDRRTPCSRSRSSRPPARSRHQLRGALRRDRRPRRASSEPDAARSCAPSSASTATTPARSRVDGVPVPPHDPSAAMRAGPRPRPGGPPQAGPRDRHERRPQRDARHPPPAPALRAAHQPRRERGRPNLGEPARGQDRRPRHRGRHPERRQPAEGRAREVARDRAARADRRRAHPRHRRRHEGRGAPPALRARRPRHRGAHDLVRTPRGARHGRPRARHARGPAHRRRSTAPTRRPRPSCAPPPTPNQTPSPTPRKRWRHDDDDRASRIPEPGAAWRAQRRRAGREDGLHGPRDQHPDRPAR